MTSEDDFDLTVKGTDRAQPPNPNEHQSDQRRKKSKPHRKDVEDEAGDRFEELIKATEIAHQKLVERDSPYRFCIYKENGEIMIDIVLLDANGTIKKIMKKNLTHENFSKWMRHIDESEGIFIDDTI